VHKFNYMKVFLMLNKFKIFTFCTLLTFSSAISALTPNEQLLEAARTGDLPGIEQALANGANIQTQDSFNNATPLHAAARNGETDAIALLLANGANIEAQDQFGKIPLHEAACNGETNAITLLLTHDANIEAQDRFFSETPLHKATWSGHTDAMVLLLAHGANIETESLHGKTALNIAAWSGALDATALLLLHGADTSKFRSIVVQWPERWNMYLRDFTAGSISPQDQLINHMIFLTQITTSAQFIALQAQHTRLQPALAQHAHIVREAFDFLYKQARIRTSLAAQAFQALPQNISPTPVNFSPIYLGDGTDLDWLHANALAQLKAQQQENQNALPIAPASSLPDDFEAPKRKRDEETNEEQPKKKTSISDWLASCQVQ
jgi:hypothetical protein